MFRRTLLPLTLASLALSVAALGAACTSDDEATPTPTESPTASATMAAAEPVTDELLRNATIRTDLVPAGEVQLEDGAFSAEAAPGSASRIEFALDSTVIDDFNADGVDDGAMVVRSSGGGSGTFYDLHVFLATPDGPEAIASEALGDRIVVQGIESGPGGVTVVYLSRPSDAPMSEAPSVETRLSVTIDANGGVTVSQSGSATATAEATASATPEGDACASLAPEAAEAAFTFVTNLVSGAVLESGTLVEGCSRTFESHVPYRLLDREGNVLVESFTMGGGVDGAAPFEFTIEYDVDAAQIGHLFVGGDDPSGGAGFPPVLNQIPVVLLP